MSPVRWVFTGHMGSHRFEWTQYRGEDVCGAPVIVNPVTHARLAISAIWRRVFGAK